MGAKFPFRPQSSMQHPPPPPPHPATPADSQPATLADTPWQVSALNNSPILEETPSGDLLIFASGKISAPPVCLFIFIGFFVI